MIFLYRSPIPVGTRGDRWVGTRTITCRSRTYRAHRKKATFLSQKNPLCSFFRLYRTQLLTVKNVIEEQTIYRYYIEILKKEYVEEKAS
jgi:hypothetical protein